MICGVFARGKLDMTLAFDTGGKGVFGVMGNACGVTVSPMRIDFIHNAVLPIV